MNDQDLLARFKALPQDVRAWLSSAEATYKIIDLDERLNLRGARGDILPDFVFRLVTQDINPRDFVSALAIELKISDSAAKAIAKLLEEQVLHRIENSLRSVGIEIQLLHFEGDKTLQPIAKLEEVAPLDSGTLKVESRKKEKIVPAVTNDAGVHHDIVASGVWKHAEALMNEAQPVTSNQQPATSVGPVILHTEEEATKPQEQAPRPIFSVKIPANKKQYVGAPAPLAARVEVPEEVQSSKFKVQSQKEEQQLETRSQPPMRALSEMKSREAQNVKRETEQTQTVGKIAASGIPPRNDGAVLKSVAPKSVATPMPVTPKIIPVVSRRVVHYSDWRTLI